MKKLKQKKNFGAKYNEWGVFVMVNSKSTKKNLGRRSLKELDLMMFHPMMSGGSGDECLNIQTKLEARILYSCGATIGGGGCSY